LSLFAGTAEWYARFRAGYPQELIEQLAAAAGLDGTGRLLDLGTGTGQLAVPLASHVAEVLAVDPEPEMLAQLPPAIGTKQARAEDVDETWGTFKLATIGRAFHWLDGDVVLGRLARVTRQVALVGDSLEQSDAQSLLVDIARELVGERPPMKQPAVKYDEALAASRFSDVQRLTATYERTRTVDDLLGFAYSTSFASLARLGDRREEFEGEVRARLKPVYRERIRVDAFLGRRDDE
jgi:ubiquinone/menaquinone biosynthesis C-methylase UbiE